MAAVTPPIQVNFEEKVEEMRARYERLGTPRDDGDESPNPPGSTCCASRRGVEPSPHGQGANNAAGQRLPGRPFAAPERTIKQRTPNVAF